jgi:hypothetical protein
MPSGYEFFKIYKSLHLHFTSENYDVFKYNGKSKSINSKSFTERKDSQLFELWSKHFYSTKSIGQFCLANFVYNEPTWIYQTHKQAEEIYIKWKSRRDSQLHYFNHDLNVLSQIMEAKKVKSVWDFFAKTPSGNKPPLLQLSLTGSVSKEFICFIDYWCYPFRLKWEQQYEIDPLISDHLFLIKKYAPFIVNTIDSVQIKKLFTEVVKNHETS